MLRGKEYTSPLAFYRFQCCYYQTILWVSFRLFNFQNWTCIYCTWRKILYLLKEDKKTKKHNRLHINLHVDFSKSSSQKEELDKLTLSALVFNRGISKWKKEVQIWVRVVPYKLIIRTVNKLHAYDCWMKYKMLYLLFSGYIYITWPSEERLQKVWSGMFDALWEYESTNYVV